MPNRRALFGSAAGREHQRQGTERVQRLVISTGRSRATAACETGSADYELEFDTHAGSSRPTIR